MQSLTDATESRPLLSAQPIKGIVFTLLSCVAGALLWALLRTAFSLDYGSATLVFTVCIVWFWQLAWSFGGWPASLLTSNRWVRGSINWTVLMLVAWLTIKCWEWWFDKPFAQTDIGLWGTTALFGGVLSLFFFGNRLLLPEGEAANQPIAGLTNLVWALGFLPLVFLFLPKLAGADPLGVPYIWFPIALIPLTYFGGQPFDRLGQPYAGLAYAGVTFTGTVLLAGILKRAGIDFFAADVAGLKGNIFVATWTDVGLVLAWLFNMWPLGRLAQPLKGVLATAGSLAISLAIYAILTSAFGAADYPAVIFGLFCFLWAQVSFAGIGLFDVLSWGHEENIAGAGPRPRSSRSEQRDGAAIEVGAGA
ncbi:MAG: hypothetical protein V7607_5453 [Solirubrobacteraceae bacterium]